MAMQQQKHQQQHQHLPTTPPPTSLPPAQMNAFQRPERLERLTPMKACPLGGARYAGAAQRRLSRQHLKYPQTRCAGTRQRRLAAPAPHHAQTAAAPTGVDMMPMRCARGAGATQSLLQGAWWQKQQGQSNSAGRQVRDALQPATSTSTPYSNLVAASTHVLKLNNTRCSILWSISQHTSLMQSRTFCTCGCNKMIHSQVQHPTHLVDATPVIETWL